jgi:rhodanese-related sulfurtransferase
MSNSTGFIEEIMSWTFARSTKKSLISSLFGIKEIEVDEVMRKISSGDRVFLIDIRDESDWEQGHASGAMHLPDSTIRLDIKGSIPDLDAVIVLYCDIGVCSLFTTDKLQKMGYTNIFSMSGGFSAWRGAGYPVDVEE